MISRHASRALLVLLMVAAAPISPISAARQAGPEATPAGKEVVTSSGLRYIDEKVGSGAEAGPGKTVEVLYTGWLEDKTTFDSSLDPNHPFRFRIGIDEVIQGWHEGITGMKAGGKRRLIVPPDLGYGSQGAGRVVPGNATLVFEVELLAVK
ncbi:MAG TPA: FKBP-type peptidyl-prolyl cis-trans isomerase [Thermoanaerobaculia bacterium]|jgi:FKBP-type peptidyl-prolyl cis-trans isomerase|nr:FKBP-type peptidyl-prolyl cis-trans isomerase [Thermoanaerobaculia bacterium]